MIRTGLRIIARKGTDDEVRKAVFKFAVWLRNRYPFPIRFPIYLSPHLEIRNREGRLVSARFFGPDSMDTEPYATVATGHYSEDRKNEGRDNALATVLCSVAHEVVHYQQWISETELIEDGVSDAAVQMIEEYSNDVIYPL